MSSSCRAFIAKRFFHYRRSFQQKAEQKKQPSNYFLSRRSNPTIAFDDAAKKIRENFATRQPRHVQPFSTGFGNLLTKSFCFSGTRTRDNFLQLANSCHKYSTTDKLVSWSLRPWLESGSSQGGGIARR